MVHSNNIDKEKDESLVQTVKALQIVGNSRHRWIATLPLFPSSPSLCISLIKTYTYSFSLNVIVATVSSPLQADGLQPTHLNNRTMQASF
jgi:hypothetical protein